MFSFLFAFQHILTSSEMIDECSMFRASMSARRAGAVTLCLSTSSSSAVTSSSYTGRSFLGSGCACRSEESSRKPSSPSTFIPPPSTRDERRTGSSSTLNERRLLLLLLLEDTAFTTGGGGFTLFNPRLSRNASFLFILSARSCSYSVSPLSQLLLLASTATLSVIFLFDIFKSEAPSRGLKVLS